MTVAIRVSIVRWVDDEPQPGIVECRFTDRFGREWAFVEKCAVVSSASLRNTDIYPQLGAIFCRVLSRGLDDDRREFVVVDTGQFWGVSATDGARATCDLIGSQVALADSYDACAPLRRGSSAAQA